MRDWKLEIEIAKKEIIEAKRVAYKTANKNIEPNIADITPRAWFISTWDTGYIVCDYEELKNIPKRKREKILSLGGINKC